MQHPSANVTAGDIAAWLASLRTLSDLPLEIVPPGAEGTRRFHGRTFRRCPWTETSTNRWLI